MKNKYSGRVALSCALIFSLAMLLFFSGCATISPAISADAEAITSLINEGNSVELSALSSESFLLDTEILHGRSLVSEFWNGLTQAGFKLENPVVIENRAPQAADSIFFGKGIDVEVFFTRYLPPQSTLFRIGSDDSEIVLILGPSEKGKSKILAFGGPF